MSNYPKAHTVTVQFETDNLQKDGGAFFWVVVRREVPLWEYIKARAKGTMRYEDGLLRELKQMTWVEYNEEIDRIRSKTYEEMERDMHTMLFGSQVDLDHRGTRATNDG